MIVPRLPRFCGSLTLLVLMGTANFSQARIGATLEEEIARYGKPVHKAASDEFAMFKQVPYYITVHFHDGKTDAITYVKSGSASSASRNTFTDDEIDKLLRINGNGRKWEQSKTKAGSPQWTTQDKTLQAVYSESKFLVIKTAAYVMRLQAAEKKKKGGSEEHEQKPAPTHHEKRKTGKKSTSPAPKKAPAQPEEHGD
jgi:hypothetical protein